MSKELNTGSKDLDTTANAGGNAGTTETENLETQDNASEGGANRLLEESKKWKKRAIEAEKLLSDKQKAESEQQGNYKKLYEEAESRYKNLYKTTVKDKVKMSLSEHAVKSGCQNLDALLKLGNSELLEYDEGDGRVNGAELFIEDAKKNHPYLFSAPKTPTINPTTPGGVSSNKKLTAADIAKLPPDQKAKAWAEALKD
jgi:hypothetical protein